MLDGLVFSVLVFQCIDGHHLPCSAYQQAGHRLLLAVGCWGVSHICFQVHLSISVLFNTCIATVCIEQRSSQSSPSSMLDLA